MSWAAIKGSSPMAVQETLRLRGTGAREEFPESEITAAELPGGCYLVVSNHDGLRLTEDEVMGRLSQLGEVVICFVEEHVMFSSVALWLDGRRIWSVEHDAQKGIEHINVQGEPPPGFPSIRDRLTREQAAAGGKKAGVDYIFDIPVQLARSITGFRHDEDTPGLGENPFEVLVSLAEIRTTPEKKPWWKRLIG